MEAIRGDLTLAELAAKHGVHHTMIGAWMRQAMDGMASLFDVKIRPQRLPARPRSRNCTPRLGNCWWGGIFWRGPPVDEHGSEAKDGRARSPEPVDHGAMPPAFDQSVRVLFAGSGGQRDAGADGRDRLGVHGLPLVWQSANGPPLATLGPCGWPPPGTAPNGQDGAGGNLSAPTHQRSAPRVPDLCAILRSRGPIRCGAPT